MLSISAKAQYKPVGNALERSPTSKGYIFRSNLGSPGFAYWYTSHQIDSLLSSSVAGVASFNSRTGTVLPLVGDYSAFYPLLSGGYVNPPWITSLPFSKITTKPTTLAGYGITDAYPLSGNPSNFVITELDPTVPTYAKNLTAFSVIQSSTDPLYRPITYVPTFASITSKPITLSGYGITDAYPLSGNPSNFLTANQTISFAPTGDVTGSTTGTTSLAPALTIGSARVTNAMLAGNIDLTTKVTGLLPDGNIASAGVWNAKQSAITFGTGVLTALGINIGSAGAPILYNGAAGTPSSLVGTNITGIPNGALNNSSITIGSTNISLGGTTTTIAGLTSLTSTSLIGALTGNATTATAWATGRTVGITGDITYTSPSLDGSSNVTAAGTLATINSNVGSFGSSTSIPSFTVDGKGRITAASGNVVIAPAGTLTGTTLASNVVNASLTTLSALTSNGILTTSGATGALSVTATTGSGSVVLATSPTLVTPSLGTPSAINIANATGMTSAQVTAALTYAPMPVLTAFNTQTASYTLVLGDGTNTEVQMNNASANNMTIPTNASVAFAIGTTITITSIGAGQTTIVPISGVTLNSAGGLTKLRVQYSSGVIKKTATNTWELAGDLQ